MDWGWVVIAFDVGFLAAFCVAAWCYRDTPLPVRIMSEESGCAVRWQKPDEAPGNAATAAPKSDP